MITLNQLAYNLLNKARGGVISDDDAINIRQVKFWIHNTRALLIRQDIQKGRSISSNILQPLACLDVEIVDASTCPCQVDVGCSILKTVRRIPKPIEVDQMDMITSVIPVKINAQPFTMINIYRSRWIGHNKYTKKNPKAFYFDGYIWILNSNPIEKVTIFGVFEDPTELASFSNCNGDVCYSDDDNYPISNWMIEMLDKIIVESDFKLILNMPTDKTNDADNNPQPNTVNNGR